MSGAEGAAWAQLPMHSLRHVPLDSLAVGSSKLGQSSCHLMRMCDQRALNAAVSADVDARQLQQCGAVQGREVGRQH